MSKVILDHNDPARVACDSAPQKTFMARLHDRTHPAPLAVTLFDIVADAGRAQAAEIAKQKGAS